MNPTDKVTASRQPEVCNVCVYCGSDQVVEIEASDGVVIDTGLSTEVVEISVPGLSCQACGLSATDHRAEAMRDQVISSRRLPKMADEIRQARRASGLSRTDWLNLTAIGDASLTRWESGSHEPNQAYLRLLYLLSFGENIDRLHDKKQKDDRAYRFAENLGRNAGAECQSHIDTLCQGHTYSECEAFPSTRFSQEQLERGRTFRPMIACGRRQMAA